MVARARSAPAISSGCRSAWRCSSGCVIAWVGRRADPDVDAARRRRRRRSPRTRSTIWRTQVRFIGAGAIAIAAICTLAKLAKPVVGGLVSTLAASRADGARATSATAISRRRGSSCSRPRASSSPAWLAFTFARSTVLAPSAVTLTLIAVPFVLLGGFLIAGDLRLHGGTHRRVEQPDLGRRHPVDRDLRHRCWSLAVPPTADDAAGARRVRALRHRDRLRVRDDLERQPAGSEDRPARRRVADAPADRAHRRRRRRRGGDPAGAQPARARRTASPARRTSASSRRIRCRRRRRR